MGFQPRFKNVQGGASFYVQWKLIPQSPCSNREGPISVLRFAGGTERSLRVEDVRVLVAGGVVINSQM